MAEAAATNPPVGHAGPSRLLSDSLLARRATKGDRRAFEAIYERYHQELYRFCLAMVGNPQDAQDALQNTMVKVLRALPGEKRQIKLKPWLYRIARNEAVETLRRRRDNAELDPEQATSTLEIAQTAEARERLRKLMVDLDELPERQRGALVMRELSGLSFEQIGTAFETSPAVARQTVYEARLSLRQMEEGREMSCETVMRELSDSDGRVTRRREVRAHLRSCADCRAFRDSMVERRTNLAAIAPLPVGLSLGLLHGILAGKASAAVGGGAAATVGTGATGAGATGGGIAGTAGAGKAIATTAVVKAAATVAVVAAVGVTAADRSGLIDVPLPGDSKHTAVGTPGSTAPSRREEPVSPSPRRHAPGAKKATAANGHGSGHRLAGEPARGNHNTAAPGASGTPGTAHLRQPPGERGRRAPQAAQHGRPEGLPPASSHGQETAAAHKSPHANPAPATSTPARERSNPAPSPPTPPPAQSHSEAPPGEAPPSPPIEPPKTGVGNGASTGAGGKPAESPAP